jgi:5-methylcytosine-specific restriction endonuclease McrA
MNRILTALLSVVLLCASAQASAHNSHHPHANSGRKTLYVHGYTTKSGKHVHGYYRAYPRRTGRRSPAGTHSVRRREKRSKAATDAFKRENPCPSTGRPSGACHGYVIDHIKPLACGGADAPSNMQWQTVAAAKAKDKWERKGCHSG